MYTAIATKSFGVDATYGLEKQLWAFAVDSNAKEESITVWYDVVLIGPTGAVVTVLSSGNYQRINTENNKKFDALRSSPIGTGITQLVTSDLAGIVSFDTFQADLTQTDPPPAEPGS